MRQNQRNRQNPDNDGFTLLELLLALGLLAMVMALLGAALGASTRAVEAITADGGTAMRAEIALSRLADDLATTRAEPGLPFQARAGDLQRLEEEQSDVLIFAAQHLPLEPEDGYRGPALIAYKVEREPGNGQRLKLLRADAPLLLSAAGDPEAVEATYLLLADGLRAVVFEVLDRRGEPWRFSVGAGVSGGADAAAAQLPAAVRIRLDFWPDADAGTADAADATSRAGSAIQRYATTALLPAGLTPVRQGRIMGQTP